MMQMDTHSTFRQIHGSVDALVAAMVSIEDAALSENTKDDDVGLRFITPNPQCATDFDYLLTTPVAGLVNDTYIAVSYTWAHKQSMEDLSIPAYRIRDQSKPARIPRPPRCPLVVFHRAVRYARSKGIKYIWIDQECIDQDDSADIDRHLKVMDSIYRKSQTTIALLSMTAPAGDGSLLDDFTQFFDGDKLARLCKVKAATKFAEQIACNTWFTRSWTFHEKYCAQSLHFLLPLPADHGLRPSSFHRLLGNDLISNISELQSSRFPVGFHNKVSTPEVTIGASKRYFEESKTLESYHVSADWSPVGSVIAISRHLEPCHNLVNSDRLAILANVCGLETRFQTRQLDSPVYSYSTCALVLGMANTYQNPNTRRKVYLVLARYILDRTFSQVLSLGIEELDALVTDLEANVTRWRQTRGRVESLTNFSLILDVLNARRPNWETSANPF